jgi:malate dehydrogenase (oxaloacetate-decarboxylating)
MLLAAGIGEVIGVDRCGAIHREETYDHPVWNEYASKTNPNARKGALSEVIAGADVFIGLSRPDVLQPEDLQRMAKDPIVFAMANPNPEIRPERAAGLARVFATGRSDYPNQLNNVLAFPGIFRGALDCRAKEINEPMKLAAAHAIASVVAPQDLNEQYIIPSIFNDNVVKAVRDAVVKEAIRTGVARRIPREYR